jgi:hypothetical protein
MDYKQKAKELNDALYGIFTLYELVIIKQGNTWYHGSKNPLVHTWRESGDYSTCLGCGMQLHYRLKLTK